MLLIGSQRQIELFVKRAGELLAGFAAAGDVGVNAVGEIAVAEPAGGIDVEDFLVSCFIPQLHQLLDLGGVASVKGPHRGDFRFGIGRADGIQQVRVAGQECGAAAVVGSLVDHDDIRLPVVAGATLVEEVERIGGGGDSAIASVRDPLRPKPH